MSETSSMKPTSTIWVALKFAGLPLLWLLFAILMVRNYFTDPYDPSLLGSAAYGHNHHGALLQGLGLSGVELTVVYLVLRPWSYRRSWSRPVFALVIFLPWTVLSMFMTMHAGGVVALHFLWLATVVMVLLICSVWSSVIALRARCTERPSSHPRERSE